jgi:hypothetical protein
VPLPHFHHKYVDQRRSHPSSSSFRQLPQRSTEGCYLFPSFPEIEAGAGSIRLQELVGGNEIVFFSVYQEIEIVKSGKRKFT